jgi:hypothetical protein
MTVSLGFSPAFARVGLQALRKNLSNCHPEGAKPTKDLGICHGNQLQRSFAALRMTAFRSFSATSKVPLFRRPRGVVRSPD